jgi:hypothetical protein
MPSKPNVGALFRKHLGKETGDALLAKIDKMTREKKTAAEIQKAVVTGISTQIENEVVSAVIVKVGPITPIKVKPIQASVKTVVGPKITTGVKANTGVQVQVGPGPITRGSK